MESISSASFISVARPVDRRASAPSPQAAPSPAGPADEVEISPVARLMGRMEDMPDVRQDMIDRVRGEIAAGGYDSPDKIDAAIQNLIEDL